ncbi:MAG: hypothetical protein K6F53_02870, partial [Lachnospiraceae bacterium]|nr:hypothetical protein [Lachnospiraceae bacterium]
KNERIEDLKEKVRNKGSLENSINTLSEKIADEAEKKEKKQEELLKIQEDISKLSEVKDTLAKLEQYRGLCEQEAAASGEYEDKRKIFPKELPAVAGLDDMIGKCEAYERAVQKASDRKLTETEEALVSRCQSFFADGIPDTTDLDRISKKADRLSELMHRRRDMELSDSEKKRLEDGRKRFRAYTPQPEEIDLLSDKWSERGRIKETLLSKKEHSERLKKSVDEHAGKRKTALVLAIVLLVLAAAFVIGGIVAYLYASSLLIAGICCAPGLLLLSIGVFLLLRRGKHGKEEANLESEYRETLREIQEEEILIRETETDCREFFERLGMDCEPEDIRGKLSELRGAVTDYTDLCEQSRKAEESGVEAMIAETEEEIRSFLGRYGIPEDDPDYTKAIYRLWNDASEYSRLSGQKADINEALQKAESLKAEIFRYLEALGFDSGEDMKGELRRLREELTGMEFIKDHLEEIRKKKREFEELHDIAAMEAKKAQTDNASSMEELNASFNRIRGEIDGFADIEKQYVDQLDEAMEKYEDIENFETELRSLQEEYDQTARKYRIISLTREYLERAKENFSGKYMAEIMEAFEKYRAMISGSGEKYELDANLNISLKEKGSLHPLECLSEGYQDMVGLCRRMAMVDAMYDKEKPFLVFDDPFVNLDEERLHGALRFLDNLSREYQVIYFACHESRSITC